MATVATITYQYGSGNNPDNRQIQFIRNGGMGTLQAKISVIGQPTHILGVLPETQIQIEMESTTEKMRRMMAERNNQPFHVPAPTQLLSNLPNIAAQDSVIQSININTAATGGRKIAVTNGPSGMHGETVVGLIITDPR